MRKVMFLRCISVLAAVVLGLFSVTVQPARAELIPTQALVDDDGSDRARFGALLDREEVVLELQRYGVGIEEAKARLAALSDEEVKELSRMVGEAPAGGDALKTVLYSGLFVFILLLVTDILGFTKVFPFTRSIR